jgi:hypothetical protein
VTDFAALIGRLSDADQLITAKRAAGRPRGIDGIAEPEVIRDRSGRQSPE